MFLTVLLTFSFSLKKKGLCVHAEDILRDPNQVAMVQSKELTLFCWGEDNNDTAVIRYLKSLGLNGIIYDNIDRFSAKESKESIFLVEARQEQEVLSKIAAKTNNTTADRPSLL